MADVDTSKLITDLSLQLAKDYGTTAVSYLFGAVMSIGSFLLALAGVLYRWHKSTIDTLENGIAEQRTALRSQGMSIDEHLKENERKLALTSDTIQSLRSELHLTTADLKGIKAGLLNLEGVCKNQQDSIHTYIEKMGVINGKFEAVFRFIDANKRSSDV